MRTERWASWVLIAVVGLLLFLRAFSDHRLTTHYTGDGPSETDLLIATENFREFGFAKLKFHPVQQRKLTPEEFPITDKKLYYTHFAPLHYWLFGGAMILGASVFGGTGEYFARCVAVLITLIGLWFGSRALQQIVTQGRSDQKAPPLWIFLLILAATPSVLAYGDTIYKQSLVEAAKWLALFWGVNLCLKSRATVWDMIPGGILCWVLIGTCFEWWLPMAAVMIFLLWRRVGTPWEKPMAWILVCFFACVMPLGLRLWHNTLALGTVAEVLQDIAGEVHERQLGNEIYQYSFFKHTAKLVVGVFWFIGISGFTLLLFAPWKVMVDEVRRKKDLWMLVFWIWGIGSLSWQVLMPQASMIHGFTYLHISQFLMMWGGIGVGFLWLRGEAKRTLATALLVVSAFRFGQLAQGEIITPVVRKSISHISSNLCQPARDTLLSQFSNIRSSVVRLAQVSLSQGRGVASTKCHALDRERFYALWLAAALLKSDAY